MNDPAKGVIKTSELAFSGLYYSIIILLNRNKEHADFQRQFWQDDSANG
jgi:hypothetical protein